MKANLILLFLIAYCFTSIAQITKQNVLQDLEVMDSLIRNHHVSPYWLNTEENIINTITSARKAIESKSNCEQSCLVELFKVMASIRDGHSTIAADSRYELFGYVPISTRWFDGELRVMRTAAQYREVLGSKVVAVDGVPIADVLDQLRTVVPQANQYRFQKFAGSYLHLPGLMFGLGITDQPGQATFTFQKKDKSFDVLLKDLPPAEEENTEFVSFLENKENLPWYQRNNSDYYWFDYDQRKDVLYFQYNRVGNMKSEGSSAFARRLWNAADSLEIDKFILDLRYNGGGSFPFSLGFIQGILDRLDINRRGHLFIITGYDTFSAAIDMLNELELKSQAIILGEYPCDRPSRPGDPEGYTLPATGTKVYLSSLYHPTALINDRRSTNSLDKEIITTWEDYQNGKDPVMDYILKYREKKTNRPVDTEAYTNALGSYSYSPTRDLRLKDVNGRLWLEIARSLETPLYPAENGLLSTEIYGLCIKIEEEYVEIHHPDGQRFTYERVSAERKCAVDYLYEGDIVKARKAYKGVKRDNPDFIEIKDHMMSFLANIVYFDLLKYPKTNAKEIARAILELGIELSDGDAPFCKYSLRFYQD